MRKFFSLKSLTSSSALALVVATAIAATGCSNPTSTAGRTAFFTDGVITDIETIDLDQQKYDKKNSSIAGAAAGAAVGQIIGRDTEGTLLGAGIGALLAYGATNMMDHTEGLRLTVKTKQGSLIVDQPYSCDVYKGAKVRLINQSNNSVQVQVLKNDVYRTLTTSSSKECSFK